VTTLPRLHAITNDEVLSRPDFLDTARRLMAAVGQRGAVHLRGSRLPGARLYELAVALAPAQEGGAWLVVNDRVDVALAAGARAVQLTSRSLPPADARLVAPALAVGASVHSIDEARNAASAGAAWAVAGHVFPTGSHPGEPARGVEFLEGLVTQAGVPIVAIGGIRPQHVFALRLAGVHGVAAIRGIWDTDDAEQAAIHYLSSYDGDGAS
jgi:thiazole tautomerase (transcriptional regulator TenI)